MAAVRLEGVGLHTGQTCVVTLHAEPGPCRFSLGGEVERVDRMVVTRASLGVTLRSPTSEREVGVVEHLLAALGGLGIHTGVLAEVVGPELPLLDGGCLRYCEALLSLGAPRGQARSRAIASGTVVDGESRYDVVPGSGVAVGVDVDFDDPVIGSQSATWDGSPESFVRDVAPSRTFGFERDAAELWSRGLARGADPAHVVVVRTDGTLHPESEPVAPDEFARHKLLDLVGDCYLSVGMIEGELRARRPGHERTHRALHAALERGLLVDRAGQ